MIEGTNQQNYQYIHVQWFWLEIHVKGSAKEGDSHILVCIISGKLAKGFMH